MNKRAVRNEIVDYAIIAVMAVIMAFNYKLFIVPNDFAPAGLGGVGTMLQYKLGFSLGWFSLIINVPLCMAAFFFLNRDFSVKSLVFVVVYSIVYIFLQQIDTSNIEYDAGGVDTIFPCLIAGIINGCLFGICVRRNGSTGGTDVVAKFVNAKQPRLNFFWVTFIINAAVAVVSFFVYAKAGEDGALVYDYKPVVLCMLYCFTTSFVGNILLKGTKTAYKFVIITSHADEIAHDIFTKLTRSATKLHGEGAYTKAEKEVLLCVVGKHQIMDLQNIIKHYPDTFAFVETVNETIGNFRRGHHDGIMLPPIESKETKEEPANNRE